MREIMPSTPPTNTTILARTGVLAASLVALTLALTGCDLSSASTSAPARAGSTGVISAANSATQDYNNANAAGCPRGVPLYLRAITKDQSYTGAYVALGDCYAGLGYFTDAIAQYNRAIALDPTQYGLYIKRAASDYSKGNGGGAIADLKAALQSAPVQAPTYASIASAFDGYQDFTDAILTMSKAIDLAPDNPLFYETRAQMYLHAQQSRQAYDDYQHAIKIAPSEAYKSSVYVAFSNVYLQQQNVDAALKAMERAINLQPNDPHLYVLSGDLHQQVGRLGTVSRGDGAIGLYRHALKLTSKGPDAIAAHEALGDVLVKLGQATQAIAEYWRAEGLTRDRPTRTRLTAKIKGATAAAAGS